MKNARNHNKAEPSALDSIDFTGFAGTDSPRHLRVIQALLGNPRPREEIDQIAGCSNGPELIAELRRRGLEVPCSRKRKIDRDGIDTLPGTYYFTQQDRQKISDWKATTLQQGGKP